MNKKGEFWILMNVNTVETNSSGGAIRNQLSLKLILNATTYAPSGRPNFFFLKMGADGDASFLVFGQLRTCRPVHSYVRIYYSKGYFSTYSYFSKILPQECCRVYQNFEHVGYPLFEPIPTSKMKKRIKTNFFLYYSYVNFYINF